MTLIPRATTATRAQAMRTFRRQLRITVWWLAALVPVLITYGFQEDWPPRALVGSTAAATAAGVLFLLTRKPWRIEQSGSVPLWAELMAAIAVLVLGAGILVIAAFDYDNLSETVLGPLGIVLAPLILIIGTVGVVRSLRTYSRRGASAESA